MKKLKMNKKFKPLCMVCYQLLYDAYVGKCGHSICSMCKDKIRQCPLCKKQTDWNPNYSVREIIEARKKWLSETKILRKENGQMSSDHELKEFKEKHYINTFNCKLPSDKLINVLKCIEKYKENGLCEIVNCIREICNIECAIYVEKNSKAETIAALPSYSDRYKIILDNIFISGYNPY